MHRLPEHPRRGRLGRGRPGGVAAQGRLGGRGRGRVVPVDASPGPADRRPREGDRARPVRGRSLDGRDAPCSGAAQPPSPRRDRDDRCRSCPRPGRRGGGPDRGRRPGGEQLRAPTQGPAGPRRGQFARSATRWRSWWRPPARPPPRPSNGSRWSTVRCPPFSAPPMRCWLRGRRRFHRRQPACRASSAARRPRRGLRQGRRHRRAVVQHALERARISGARGGPRLPRRRHPGRAHRYPALPLLQGRDRAAT